MATSSKKRGREKSKSSQISSAKRSSRTKRPVRKADTGATTTPANDATIPTGANSFAEATDAALPPAIDEAALPSAVDETVIDLDQPHSAASPPDATPDTLGTAASTAAVDAAAISVLSGVQSTLNFSVKEDIAKFARSASLIVAILAVTFLTTNPAASLWTAATKTAEYLVSPGQEPNVSYYFTSEETTDKNQFNLLLIAKLKTGYKFDRIQIEGINQDWLRPQFMHNLAPDGSSVLRLPKSLTSADDGLMVFSSTLPKNSYVRFFNDNHDPDIGFKLYESTPCTIPPREPAEKYPIKFGSGCGDPDATLQSFEFGRFAWMSKWELNDAQRKFAIAAWQFIIVFVAYCSVASAFGSGTLAHKLLAFFPNTLWGNVLRYIVLRLFAPADSKAAHA